MLYDKTWIDLYPKVYLEKFWKYFIIKDLKIGKQEFDFG